MQYVTGAKKTPLYPEKDSIVLSIVPDLSLIHISEPTRPY